MWERFTIPDRRGFELRLPLNFKGMSRDVYLFSPMKELTDGIVMGMFIGGLMGVLHGTLNDCRGKQLYKLSTNWAFNGAIIGAVAAGLSCIIFSILLRIEKTPTFYTR